MVLSTTGNTALGLEEPINQLLRTSRSATKKGRLYLQLFQRTEPVEGMLLDALNFVLIKVAFERRERKKH